MVDGAREGASVATVGWLVVGARVVEVGAAVVGDMDGRGVVGEAVG